MTDDWVVLKFGGTSVSTAQRWKVICAQVKKLRAQGCKVWVVISAVSQVTNLLQTAIIEAVQDNKHFNSFQEIAKKHINLAVFCSILREDQQKQLYDAILSNEVSPEILKPFERLIDAFQVRWLRISAAETLSIT